MERSHDRSNSFYRPALLRRPRGESVESVVVSLGGSVLVPGEDDARYIRELAALLVDLSHRLQLFVVTGGGRVARYYIETGRELKIPERILDEFGIEVTRMNARLLGAALRGRANREPARTYREAAALARRFRIVLMAGTAPGHTTDRVSASLARHVRAARLVNATSVDGVFSADPRSHADAKLLSRIGFDDLVRLVGEGHPAAGPNVIFDPLAARVVARSRIPLAVVRGRALAALRDAILGHPFPGTIVAD
jgi:uridylate kinase